MRGRRVNPSGLLVRMLVPLGILLLFGCSGQQQDDEELEVQNEQYGGNYENEEAGQEGQGDGQYQDQQGQGQGQQGYNEQGYNEQGYNDQGAENNEYADQSLDGNQSGNYASQGQLGEEEDLQEIIEEMNGQQAEMAGNGMVNDNYGMAEANPAANAAGGAGNAMAADYSQGAPGAPPVDNGAMAMAPPPPATAPAIPFQPGGSPAAPGLPELGSKMPYVVVSGDTLGKISNRIYGDMSRWNEIASLTGMANPSRIFPGDLVYYTLDEQSVAFATAYESVQRMEEQVQPGDTLATIAARVTGSSNNWRSIWRHNDRIDNPDIVPPGSTVYYIQEGALMSEVKRLRNLENVQAEGQTIAATGHKPQTSWSTISVEDTDFNQENSNKIDDLLDVFVSASMTDSVKSETQSDSESSLNRLSA